MAIFTLKLLLYMKRFFHRVWSKYLKRNQFLYFLKVRLKNNNYKNYLRDMNSGQFKDKKTIKREMAIIRDYWHCQPLHYVRYRLFEKNLTDQELVDYVPPFVYYLYHLPTVLENFDKRYDNKLFQLEKFREKQVLTPSTVAIFNHGALMDLDGNLMDYAHLVQQFNDGEKVFCKPEDGCGGYGIQVLQRSGNLFKHRKTLKLSDSLSDFLGKSGVFLIQRQVRQIEFMDRINSGCINTFRVVTKNMNGSISIVCIFLRAGRRLSDIDNNTQGGMSLNVNIETGEIADTAILEHGNDKFDRHPDSGFVFKGQFIPNWSDYKQQMLEIATKFPDLTEVGWDFALTPQGVMTIELNIGFGLDLMQLCCGPMRVPLCVNRVAN